MSELSHLAATIFRRGAHTNRVIVAVAGPPAAGKSTIAAEVAALLPEGSAAVVSMDGFHYDDGVLEQIGLRHRKGAPETFDFGGYESLLHRLKAADADVAAPVFDRSIEISRGSASIVPRDAKFIITEGNYLLLNEDPWTRLAPLFEITVFLDVPREEVERRLVQRWIDSGRGTDAGRAWIDSNDMPNVDRVLANSRKADVVL
ncbi:MAG: nucleoside/nucleotide kinase family protein [Rhizobiaceae bacterium]|nr:nucleoside/nucleotide kinase family protein [Rhizobiaceae bacterium]